MEKLYGIEVQLDYCGFKGKDRGTFVCNYDQLLLFGWEFRRGVLVHLENFLINKRHIVTIRCIDFAEGEINQFLKDVLALEENPTLSNKPAQNE